eukprot:jgi/Botrbrau1/23026/Bobra.136_1s0017.1
MLTSSMDQTWNVDTSIRSASADSGSSRNRNVERPQWCLKSKSALPTSRLQPGPTAHLGQLGLDSLRTNLRQIGSGSGGKWGRGGAFCKMEAGEVHQRMLQTSMAIKTSDHHDCS